MNRIEINNKNTKHERKEKKKYENQQNVLSQQLNCLNIIFDFDLTINCGRINNL